MTEVLHVKWESVVVCAELQLLPGGGGRRVPLPARHGHHLCPGGAGAPTRVLQTFNHFGVTIITYHNIISFGSPLSTWNVARKIVFSIYNRTNKTNFVKKNFNKVQHQVFYKEIVNVNYLGKAEHDIFCIILGAVWFCKCNNINSMKSVEKSYLIYFV